MKDQHTKEQDVLPPTKTIAEVINEVAAKYGVSYVELISHRRPMALVRARQEAYWRCTKETIASLPTIGRHFGNRDHSTIQKGAQTYERRVHAHGLTPDQTAAAAAPVQGMCENGAP